MLEAHPLIWVDETKIIKVKVMSTLLNRFSKYSIVILGFLAITLSHATDERAEDISILDIDASGDIDALTDGLLMLRGMFGLTDEALITGVVSSQCVDCDPKKIEQYLSTLSSKTYADLISTDDQNISGSSLDGTTLTIAIENGESETVDLSSLKDLIGITADQENAIAANTGKTSMVLGTSSSTALAGDTATISSDQATAITANTAKTGISSDQANAIIANTAKVVITKVNDLSDALVEDNSIYIGNDPSNTTDSARFNIAFGLTALDAVTTGDKNVAIGHHTLGANTTGTSNMALGNRALFSNIDGGYNTASGSYALYSNTEGYQNTASGSAALVINTTGDYNTASGAYSLSANTIGYENDASGWKALYSNTEGYQNTASGSGALLSNTFGNHNTAIGAYALFSNITGDNNTAIGNLADVASSDLTNATAIGYRATVTSNNTMQLGNSSLAMVKTNGDMTVGSAYYVASDRRLKKNIVDTRRGLNTILELHPVDYQMKSNDSERIGFIAQELRLIVPEVVSGIEGDLDKGETLRIAYTNLIPVLTKAIQEQQMVIKQLQKDMEILKQKADKS